MSSDYKPVPEGATKLSLYIGGCGDDYCNCSRVEINAEVPVPEHAKHYTDSWSEELWENSYFGWDDYYTDKEFAKEVQENVKTALERYGMPVPDLSECPYDWESELIL